MRINVPGEYRIATSSAKFNRVKIPSCTACDITIPDNDIFFHTKRDGHCMMFWRTKFKSTFPRRIERAKKGIGDLVIFYRRQKVTCKAEFECVHSSWEPGWGGHEIILHFKLLSQFRFLKPEKARKDSD